MAMISLETFINAPVRFAYRAFTNSTSLREWLCDVATVEPHPLGRMYLAWNGDFYSSGHYLELEPDKRVKFRWFSNMDPVPTEVTVTISEQDGGALVRLEHEVPDDEAWKGKVVSFRDDWTESLENLKSVLETGVDLRIADRPMLGIVPGDFSEEQAQALGVPVREGLRLDGVVDGMGAQACGLQRDDVLVEFAGHALRNDASSFANAIKGRKGGETIQVVFYRGPEKKTVNMQLTRRPMPEVPFDPAEFERRVRELSMPALAELEQCFADVSDAQAMQRPEPNEWSALEIVAHLIAGERFNLIFLTGLIDGYEPITDGFGTNVHAQVRATVQANPSVDLMLDTLRRAVEETLAYICLLPEEFVANKGSYHRFAFGLLQPNFHLTAHTEQIKTALAAVRA
jgi:uncharacterized protein YndB with AHSA1/START domain